MLQLFNYVTVFEFQFCIISWKRVASSIFWCSSNVHSSSHPPSTVFSNVLIIITIANPDCYRFVFLPVILSPEILESSMDVKMKITHDVAGKTLSFHSCTARHLCCNSVFFYKVAIYNGNQTWTVPLVECNFVTAFS